jgi:hypothetical protein
MTLTLKGTQAEALEINASSAGLSEAVLKRVTFGVLDRLSGMCSRILLFA